MTLEPSLTNYACASGEVRLRVRGRRTAINQEIKFSQTKLRKGRMNREEGEKNSKKLCLLGISF